ncbi:major facilitator superfamily domain-containing protein [Obelidium mucronatum]|nr:major facilitator superfamily domain-containing protein [Obelidium mucronatum]
MVSDVAPATKAEDSDQAIPGDLDAIMIPLPRIQFILVFVATCAAFMLAALDGTIVSTALRSIIEEFGEQEKAPWIGSVFLLCGCSVDILFGKLADVFGRKWPFVASIILFVFGSILCGASTSMDMLIASRAIAGFGTGGIFSLSTIVVSDIVSLKERGAYQGIIGAIFGVSSILGPVVGGVLSDKISWRWCFYLNVPIGLFSILVFLFCSMPIPEGSFAQKAKKIDVVGTLAIFATLTALLLPIQMGGTVWPWKSAQVIGSFAISPLLIGFTVWWQTQSTNPMIPFELFENPSVLPLLLIAVLFIVNDMSATAAGIQQLPMVLSSVITTILSGLYVSKYLSYLPFLYIGPVFMILGSVLISLFSVNTTLIQQIGFLFLFGVGTGSLLQIRILGVQASVRPDQVAMITAISNMFNGFGGALGIALIGTVFNNLYSGKVAESDLLVGYIGSLETMLPEAKFSGLDLSQPLVLLEVLKQLLPTQQGAIAAGIQNGVDVLKNAFVDSFRVAFLCLIPFAVLVAVCALFVKDGMKKMAETTADEEVPLEDV